MTDALDARWRHRLTNQPRVDAPPKDWLKLDEPDELFSDLAMSTPGPAELLAWLWDDKVLRRYLVKVRVEERWYAPKWVVMAYDIAPGAMTDQGLRPLMTHGMQNQRLPSLQETRWLALRMHRDPTFRGRAQTIYRLGGVAKLMPLVPRKRPKRRRTD